MSPAKRAFDLFWVLLGLAVVWPLFVLIAFLIKLEDGGAVFFRQKRVGYHGRAFRIWKFRTMVVEAEERGKPLTVGRDPRITRVGRWLRKTNLDELPQLINVVKGEMSLVGPRPEVPRYVALYTPEERKVLELIPGMTDPASIAYRSESELLAQVEDPERFYIAEIMPTKLRLNLDYARRATVISDCVVILRTLLRLPC